MTLIEILHSCLIVINIVIVGYLAFRLKRSFRTKKAQDTAFMKGLSIDLFRQFQSFMALRELVDPGPWLPPLRGWAGSPDFLLVVARHILQQKPVVLVECGGGASTLILARCCQITGTGHVYSLDHDPFFARKTREIIAEAGLLDWVTIIEADLVENGNSDEVAQDALWYDKSKIPTSSVDMVLVDGPPMPINPMIRYPAGPFFWPQLSKGGVIFADDTATAGGTETVKRWEEEFQGAQSRRFDCEKGCVAIYKIDIASETSSA
ncbi:MAG: class I SAM-dependent methyltransferase [Alphaproteobacteria bacterium]